MNKENVEIELSYCFTKDHTVEELAEYFSENVFNSSVKNNSVDKITDHYLKENVRARFHTGTNKEITRSILTKKTGNKSDSRLEQHADLSPESSYLLAEQSKLTVTKTRYSYQVGGYENIEFTIDDVHMPMSLKIVEIECDSLRLMEDLDAKIPFTSNTEAAWKYFKKKIAFAGGPSSGKSTLCRQLVNDLSINYGVNVEQVTEYARTHISRYGVPEWAIQPVMEWSQEQRERDAGYSSSIVTDCPRFLAYIYGIMNYDRQLDKSSVFLFTRLYEGALNSLLDYSNVILLNQPNKMTDDGIRYQTEEEARQVYDYVKGFLKQHHCDYISWSREKNLDDLILQIFNLNRIIDAKV